MSDLLQRAKLALLAGLQFGGKRDLYEVLGYKRVLTFDDYYAKYQRQDIAKRVVAAPPRATWRNPPTLKLRSNKKESANFQKAWDKLAANHHIWGKIEKADKLSGIGRYGIMLLGLSDSTNFETPVNGDQETELLYVQAYTEANAEIVEYDQSPTSPRFGQPLKYKLTIKAPTSSVKAVGKTARPNPISTKDTELVVHYTRIIHIAEDTLDDNVIGTPRLEAVFNAFDDLIKVTGGTAETYWLTANRGMQLDIDKDAELSVDDAKALADEIDEFQHQLRRVIRTRGVKTTVLGSDIPDPKNSFDMIISVISGATGIPKRILTGSEVGQLASDQDRANWADLIKERRATYAEPVILLPLLRAFVKAGILPEFKEEDLEIEWPPNFQLTPLEEAQSMAQKGRAAINLAKHLSEPNPILTREECRTILGVPTEPEDGTLPAPIDPNDIMQAEMDAKKAAADAAAKQTNQPTTKPTKEPSAKATQ